MSVATAALAATSVSLAAFGMLAARDPKRRRAFGLPPPSGPGRPGVLWAAALAPGALVPFWGGGGAFVIWLGGTGVAGWALAAIPPGALAEPRRRLVEAGARGRVSARRSARALRAAWRQGRRWLGARTPSTLVERTRIEVLERRVADLEARLAALSSLSAEPAADAAIAQQIAGPVVVELARGRSQH